MQKKLIALAIASAFVAPAFAATSNVEIGGGLNFSVDYLDADTASQDGNLNVSSNSSNIYFKGTEDLGGGLKALWHIQTYFSAGGTGNADTGVAGEAVKDGVASGNTYVGLTGGFGTVLLGRMEAPAKLVGRKVDLFGDQLGDNRNLLSKPNGKTNGFDLRPNNTMAYATPNISGLVGTLAYVTNVGDTGAATEASTTAWSASGVYENGPLMLALGYQRHNVDAANLDESVLRLSGSYSMGDLRFVGIYQKADNDATGANDADVNTWGLGAAYKMGAITLKGQYYSAGEADDVANSDADMWALGVDYALSKRTTTYAAYASTDNEGAAKYSAFGGGHGDQPTIAVGGNPSGFQIGVKHTF